MIASSVIRMPALGCCGSLFDRPTRVVGGTLKPADRQRELDAQECGSSAPCREQSVAHWPVTVGSLEGVNAQAESGRALRKRC